MPTRVSSCAALVLVLLATMGTTGCVTVGDPEPAPMTQVGNVPPGADLTGRVLARGMASWYGDEFAGKPTASGEPYDPKAFTCAHATLPFGTWVRVVARESRQAVSVRVTDRFPATKGRVIDLSPRAFAQLAPLEDGLVEVELYALTLQPTDQYPAASRQPQIVP